MAIDVRVEQFIGRWAAQNTANRVLPVNIADVVRAAVTVGGPVLGSQWHSSLRRAGVAGVVLSALVGTGRGGAVTTSNLYRQLETTEKSGASFRLGMALAALAAEHVLGVRLLDHLNRTNSVLAPGSRRRADLFGMDGGGRWHVVEAKSRTYGFEPADVAYAKQQAINVQTVQTDGAWLVPATQSASLTDLSQKPISVLLVDPRGEPAGIAQYEIDIERFVERYYSAVPDLIEVQRGPQPPPQAIPGADVLGAFLPGMEIWLGLDAALVAESGASWIERVQEYSERSDVAQQIKGEHVSFGRDGYVLQLGSKLAETYERSGEAGIEGSDEGSP